MPNADQITTPKNNEDLESNQPASIHPLIAHLHCVVDASRRKQARERERERERERGEILAIMSNQIAKIRKVNGGKLHRRHRRDPPPLDLRGLRTTEF